jgi:putative spermidine/putrescine transport system permease protein
MARARPDRKTLLVLALILPVFALFTVGYLVPLAQLALKSVHSADGWSLQHYVEIATSGVFPWVLLRTLTLSFTVTVICLLLAYPLAYAISRCPPWLASVLLLLVTLPYLTSILIRTYAWTVILSPAGLVNQLLLYLGVISEPVRLVFNMIGVYIGMVQVQLPLMIFPLYAALARFDRRLSAAAQSLGSSPADAFFRITLPMSSPGIISGCTLVFLSCLGFYITPALLGGPDDYMIAQGITIRVLTLGEFEAAAAQSMVLLAIVVVIFVVFRRRVSADLDDEEQIRLHAPKPRAKSYSTASVPGLRVGLEILSKVRLPLLVLASGITLALLVLPFVVVIPLAFSDAAYLSFPPPGYSLRWFSRFFGNTQWLSALGFSAKTASIAALVAVIVGVPAAFALVRHKFVGRVPAYLILISPLIVPHVIMAVAFFFSVAGTSIVGSAAAFVLSYTIIATPYVIVIFAAGLKRFDRSLEQAAISLGGHPLTAFRTITMPLLMPSLASALVFAFITGFDDVVYGLFVSGPSATPLPIRMWDDIRLEISPQIAVVAVLFLAAMVTLFVIRNFVVMALHQRVRTSEASQ